MTVEFSSVGLMWTYIAFMGVAVLAALILYAKKEEPKTPDRRTTGDKLHEAIVDALALIVKTWVVWLTWNHVAVREFDVPTISYPSAFWFVVALSLAYKAKGSK